MKLAGLMHWDASTVRRKLLGKSKITHSDVLAIGKALADRAASGTGPSLT